MDFFQSEGILDEATLGVVTIALSQIAKSYVSKRFVSLVPLAIAVVLSLIAGGFSIPSGLKGLVVGLTAAGFYDQKALVK
tara:strand:- start:2959 stop:3198 length:240 start_codon:yes stop_codon:yes gene_type:complete